MLEILQWALSGDPNQKLVCGAIVLVVALALLLYDWRAIGSTVFVIAFWWLGWTLLNLFYAQRTYDLRDDLIVTIPWPPGPVSIALGVAWAVFTLVLMIIVRYWPLILPPSR